MRSTGTSSATRVVSRDGTDIGYWTSGEGPPLVAVHGTASHHTTWDAVLPHLERDATVHAVDRRGRGASGDRPEYALAREFEDVAAVVDAVAARAGSKVDVLGHSFGGLCAVGAAGLTSNLRRLVLYEGWPVLNRDPIVRAAIREREEAVLPRLEALLERGDAEAILGTFYRDLVGMTEEEVSAFRAIPGWWQQRLAAAHTIPRELAAGAEPFEPDRASRITVPTLLLVGADSPDHMRSDHETVAATLPDVQVTFLEGQEHLAHLVAPETFAEHVLAFLRGR